MGRKVRKRVRKGGISEDNSEEANNRGVRK